MGFISHIVQTKHLTLSKLLTVRLSLYPT